MSIKSRIYLSEKVSNSQRKFGSATDYHIVYVTDTRGNSLPALFTCDQIDDAVERARANPEDIVSQKKSLVDTFLSWF